MNVNRYLPFAFVYFFINSFALPFGLTYTALLAPLFYVWIVWTRKKETISFFVAALIPFILIHLLIVGVDIKTYFISLLNILLVYIFCQAVYTFFKVCQDPEKIFRAIVYLNFIACVFAIILYFTPYWDWLWVQQSISSGVGARRLKMLTYEPSYYALIFIPFFFFYLLQYLFKQNTISGGLLLLMIFLPYILSFSIGVISVAIIAGLLTWFIHFRKMTRKRRLFNSIINTGAVGISLLGASIFFFRQNALFLRLSNIIYGNDSSGNGRTTDAFILANKLLDEKSHYWGVGIGQIKVMGESIIRDYYFYYMDQAVAIPNACAETLAVFGIVGLTLRLGLEIFLFFYTRTWSNYYRLLLFLFMFIYQFTGSFITNVAEYVIWILAFTNVFKQFDVQKRTVIKN
jgi:hypothetical protein